MTSLPKPTEIEIDQAVPLLSSPQHERYFFDHLKNPHWIDPLRQRGFFDHPPAAEKVEGGGVRYPSWPEAGYLVRMAPLAPEEVASIFEAFETDNWSVARHVIKAAQAMPAAQAVRLIPKIIDWVQADVLWHDLKEIAELCVKLVAEYHPDGAIDLALGTFHLRWTGTRDNRRTRDEYWYIREMNNSLIPAMIPVRARPLIEHLLGELAAAIEADRFWRDDPAYDASYVWRPAVEEHEQNRDFDVRSKLVGCICQAAELAIENGYLSLHDLMQMLSTWPHLIFKRIRIHLIRRFAEQDPGLTRQTLMDQSLFDDTRTKHEYAMLARDRFGMLADSEQSQWLQRADDGPQDLASCSQEEREARKRWWRVTKLVWIRPYLEGERREFVDQAIDEKGEPHFAFFVTYGKVRHVRHKSPFSAEELSNKPFEEIVERVATWRMPPDGDPIEGPSYEGLREGFRKYCSARAEEASRQARILKSRPAPYVRAFLNAMTQALNEGKSIDLDAVLELCHWVHEQPVTEDASPDDEDREPGFIDRNWQWTRDAIAELAHQAFEQNVPLDHRKGLWDAVHPLTEGSDGSYIVRDLEALDIRSENFADYTINSAQGKAMRSVMAYARWVAKAVTMEQGNQEIVGGGFERLPEVRALLERKLSSADSGGFAARAMYGWHVSLLYWIDRDWLAEHVAAIFDLGRVEEDPATAYGWAAWNTFLMSVHPHIELYEIMRDQYAYAVEQASQLEADTLDESQPFAHLGEHLIVLYGRGELGFDTDDRIIRGLLTKASPPVRTHAIQFVGQTLNDDEPLPANVRERFMALWDWYWAEIGRYDAAADPTSAAFGWWFACGKFDNEWSLERLEQFVQVVPKPEPDFHIVERLAQVCHVDPFRATRILKHMIEGDDENWRVHGWIDEARRILAEALKEGGEAKNLAMEAINQLGRRGFFEFRELTVDV